MFHLLGVVLCSFEVMCARSPVAKTDREVGPLQPAAHATLDQAWGSMLDPGSQSVSGMSAQSLISGWQKIETTVYFLLSVGLAFVLGEKLLV